MKAVPSALADGAVTPGEAATIAAVVDTFARAVETSDFDQRLQLVEASHPTIGAPQSARTAPGGWVLQPIGEILLLNSCRYRERRSSMQSVIAAGQPAKGHRGSTEIGLYSRFSQPDGRGSCVDGPRPGKDFSACRQLKVACGHVSGLLSRPVAAGLDGFRGSRPDQAREVALPHGPA